jgi:hypothetical protein
MLGEAKRAVRALPPGSVAGQRFKIDVPQVALYAVGVHWSLGDAGQALEAGKGLSAGMFPTPERKGRLHTDLARAWHQRGRPEEAVWQLLEASRYAPGEVRDRPAIRAMATDLVDRHKLVPGARELATVIGRRR